MGVIVRPKVKGRASRRGFSSFITETSRRVGTKEAAVEVATKIQARLHLGEFYFE